MLDVGFEPTPLSGIEFSGMQPGIEPVTSVALESTALDHSANPAGLSITAMDQSSTSIQYLSACVSQAARPASQSRLLTETAEIATPCSSGTGTTTVPRKD